MRPARVPTTMGEPTRPATERRFVAMMYSADFGARPLVEEGCAQRDPPTVSRRAGIWRRTPVAAAGYRSGGGVTYGNWGVQQMYASCYHLPGDLQWIRSTAVTRER